MKNRSKRLCLVVVLLSMTLLLTACGGPEATYKQAQDLMSQSKYTEAAAKYASIIDYEDAATWVKYCEACALCETENYDAGVAALEELGDFGDSIERAAHYSSLAGPEFTYKKAQNLLSQGKYTEAAANFESIGSYEDATTLTMYCKACALCEAGNYETGIAALEKLGDYKDCAFRITYYTARFWDEKSIGTTEFEWMQQAKSIYNENPLYLDSAERVAALDSRIAEAQQILYDEAVAAADNGQYDEAINTFVRLSNYSDSEKRVAYYFIRNDEIALAESTDHKAVYAVAVYYAQMGEYLDCAERAVAMNAKAIAILDDKYNAAVALMTEGKYGEAITAFTEIVEHKDSATQITACETAILDEKYDAAVALMNEEKYDDAITAFTAIKTHRDSAAQIVACETAIMDVKYDAAVALMNEGKYSEAITAFTAIESHKDSAKQIKVCETAIMDVKYDAAVVLLNEGKYLEAYIAFVSLNGHRDSEVKANAILQIDPMVQYRGASIGSYVTFGSYEQDNNPSNGKEDIEWLVLAKENNRLLVISRYALDVKTYHEVRTDITWQTCSLRRWMNNSFLNTAFTGAEKAMIPTVKVTADKNPEYGNETKSGNATQDKVFLLSIQEVNKYFASDDARKCKLTVYAAKQSTRSVNQRDFCIWWLRTNGGSQTSAARVYRDGSVNEGGEGVYIDYAVRPTLWIEIQ